MNVVFQVIEDESESSGGNWMKEYKDKLIEIGKQCTCNIFNIVWAAQILRGSD
jgi:hypothetical protein